MKAYKGFNKDMTCRGFKFEEGKTYEESEAILCKRGFHACTNPIDVFTYYPPATSVYHEVELDDVSKGEEEDTKICGRKIKIGKQLNFTTLHYHRLDDLTASIGLSPCKMCTYCFNHQG